MTLRDRDARPTRAAWQALGWLLAVGSVGCTAGSLRSGSAVIAARTPSAIVIAADSRVMIRNRTRPTRFAEDGCKIRIIDSVVFAAAGMQDLSRDTDIYTLAKQATSEKTVELMAKTLVQSIRVTIEGDREMLDLSPQNDDGHATVSHFIFVQMDGSQPVGAIGEVVAMSRAPLRLESVVNGFGAPREIGLLGEAAALSKHDVHGGELRSDATAAAELRRLIERVAKIPKDAPFVGGPTDIISVGADGIRWIKKKSGC